jgi:hypothetical protein
MAQNILLFVSVDGKHCPCRSIQNQAAMRAAVQSVDHFA